MFALLLVTAAGATSCANAQKEVDVKTLFDLMPSEAFILLNADTPAELEQYITVYDDENRYLRLEFEDQSYWEMCYWNLEDGNKLIAVSSYIIHSFFLYSNGELTLTTGFGIEEINSNIYNSFVVNPYDNWFRLHVPRYGTSIYLSINGLASQIYKWQNEQFVRIDIYPTPNSTHHDLVEGFAAALITADADYCLQYILPCHVSEQCMQAFEGNVEDFICDLISSEDEQGFIKPGKLGDIKNATYRYTPDDGFANHTIFIELNDGRSYTYYLSLESVEMLEMFDNGEYGEVITGIPYITGGVG